MEPLAVLAAFTAAFTAYEKLSKFIRDWTTKLPDTPAKQAAVKDLEHAEEALQLAKIELAKGFGFPICKRHFPPGVLLDIREDVFPKWKCSTCGHIPPTTDFF